MKDLFHKCDMFSVNFKISIFRISNFLPNIGITYEQITFSAVFACKCRHVFLFCISDNRELLEVLLQFFSLISFPSLNKDTHKVIGMRF